MAVDIAIGDGPSGLPPMCAASNFTDLVTENAASRYQGKPDQFCGFASSVAIGDSFQYNRSLRLQVSGAAFDRPSVQEKSCEKSSLRDTVPACASGFVLRVDELELGSFPLVWHEGALALG